jgi:hypothetical protein
LWPKDEDEEHIKDGVMSCTVCEDLEEEEVMFIKSWFEEEVGVKGLAEKEVVQEQGQEKVLVYGGTDDENIEEVEVDGGECAFTVGHRKRAKPKKKISENLLKVMKFHNTRSGIRTDTDQIRCCLFY